MGFQPGNQHGKVANHKRPKLFTNALLASLKKVDEKDVEAIQRIADKLVKLAEDGDVSAIKEIADRVEGKVPQAIVGDNEADPVNILQRIERLIVDPANTNSEGVPPALAAS